MVEGVNVFPVASLADVIELLNSTLLGQVQRPPFRVATEALLGELHHYSADFSDVRGQQTAKRALEGSRSRWSQYSDDRASWFGKDDAGQTPAVDSRAPHF